MRISGFRSRRNAESPRYSGMLAAQTGCTNAGLVQAVDSSAGPQSFLITVPGVAVYSIQAFLAGAGTVRVADLVPLVDAMVEETSRTDALLLLAERVLREGG